MTDEEIDLFISKELNFEIPEIYIEGMLSDLQDFMGEYFYKAFNIKVRNKDIDGAFYRARIKALDYFVGVHKSQWIMLDENKIKEEICDDDKVEYKLRLILQMISKRKYISKYLRKTSLYGGDNFIYYPVPYFSLVVTAICLDNLKSSDDDTGLYTIFLNKCLAVLELLQCNLLDSSAEICRSLVELAAIIDCIENSSTVKERYKVFYEANYYREQYGDKSKEFLNFCEDHKELKVNKTSNSYWYYGWIDALDKIEGVDCKNNYNLTVILDYLIKYHSIHDVDMKNNFINIENFYRRGNKYIHNQWSENVIPYSNLIDIAPALYNVIGIVFQHLKKLLPDEVRDELYTIYQFYSVENRKMTEQMKLFMNKF